jgi:hypothetical protein
MSQPPATSSTSFSGWLTSKPATDKEPESATVLSDWKSYSSKSQAPVVDVEAGASLLTSTLASSFKAVATTASSALDSASVSQQQYAYFFASAGVGVLLLLLSFFVFLPMIIIRPSKFAITFSLGSILIIISLGFLRGWRNMLGTMASKERLGPTVLYIGSLCGTLYASMMLHSYLLSIGMCGVQVAMLAYYVASLVPGGAEGAKALGMGGISLVKRAVFGGSS